MWSSSSPICGYETGFKERYIGYSETEKLISVLKYLPLALTAVGIMYTEKYVTIRQIVHTQQFIIIIQKASAVGVYFYISETRSLIKVVSCSRVM